MEVHFLVDYVYGNRVLAPRQLMISAYAGMVGEQRRSGAGWFTYSSVNPNPQGPAAQGAWLFETLMTSSRAYRVQLHRLHRTSAARGGLALGRTAGAQSSLQRSPNRMVAMADAPLAANVVPWCIAVVLWTYPQTHGNHMRYCIRGIDLTAPSGFSNAGWAWDRGLDGVFRFRLPSNVP